MSELTLDRAQSLGIMLVCPDAALARQFQESAATLAQLTTLVEFNAYPSLKELVEQVRLHQPDAILVDVGSDRPQALELLAQIGDQWPTLSTVALHRSNDPETILQCLRSGASEFLCSPFAAQDVTQAVERMMRRKGLQSRPEPGGQGRILAFAPAKGGSGCTTLACNSAFQIKKTGRGRVLLADFNPLAGVVAFLLRMTHPYSMMDALKHANQLDPNLWGSIVKAREGVDILPAPERPEPAIIEPYPVQEVLQYARSVYDYVVVDLGSVCESVSMATLTVADEIYLVCGADLPSLFMMRRTLPLLEEMGHNREQIHVLVNRLERRAELSTADMEKIFRATVHSTFPRDTAAVNRALRDGVALAENSDLGRSISRFVKGLVGKQAVASPRTFGIGVLKELLS